MQRSHRSPKKKVHFMAGIRMASSHENLAGLDLRDLTSDMDISMESLSPIMAQAKTDKRNGSFRRLQTSAKRISPSINDSGSGLDNIIAELDEGIAELTDQPVTSVSQNSALTSKMSSLQQHSLRQGQIQASSVDEILRNARQNVVMEFGEEEQTKRCPSPADRLRQSMSQQIPVKHCSSKGTQRGMLLPKYHTRGESKCIRCRDCGIFYTPGSFLKHFHDRFGRRQDCDGGVALQLDVQSPTEKEIRLWEEFQMKLQQISPRKRPATFTDSLLLSKCSRQNGALDVSGLREEEMSVAGELSDEFNPQMSGISMDDSALPRRHGSRRERRPSAPGLLIRKAGSMNDLDRTAPRHNKPVIMGLQPAKSNSLSKKNNLQKYLPSDMREVSRMSADSVKTNLRSHGSLRRTSSLSNISSVANGTLTPEEKSNGSPLSNSITLHPEDDRPLSTLHNIHKEDPVYILQTAQELISLATSRLGPGNFGNDSVWAEKFEQERTLRLQTEEKVRNLERRLQEEKIRREVLEEQVRAYKTCLDS